MTPVGEGNAAKTEAPKRRLWPILASAGLAVLLLAGLFARVMAFPISHDEQLYVSAGVLFGQGDLYRDLGYNHVPNLPPLYRAVFDLTGDGAYLLTARAVTFVAWLAAFAALALFTGWRTPAARIGWGLGCLLLATNTLLIDTTGTLATNNFLPLPMALAGLALFARGVEGDDPRLVWIVGGGFLLALAAGFKVSFLAAVPPAVIGALLLPRALPLPARLRRVVPWLALGGVAGAAPVLYRLATDPQGFLAHALRYHTGPHAAYWEARGDGAVMGLGEKLIFANELWLSGVSLLTLTLVTALALLAAQREGWRAAAGRLLDARAGLLLGTAACTALLALLPTPAFPQYYAPPTVFLAALAALLVARAGPGELLAAKPVLAAAALVALVVGGPRLASDLPSLANPSSWTGNELRAASKRIAGRAGEASEGVPPLVATLAPLQALEAGMRVYPELAVGPFVYRVADLIAEDDRPRYRLVSKATLPGFLDADPPDAVLVGFGGELDRAFEKYALSRGYERQPGLYGRDRYGEGALYLRPEPEQAARTAAAAGR